MSKTIVLHMEQDTELKQEDFQNDLLFLTAFSKLC